LKRDVLIEDFDCSERFDVQEYGFLEEIC
jgi:hypothetical protein